MADEFTIPGTGEKVDPSRGLFKGIAKPVIMAFLAVLTLLALLLGALATIGRAQDATDTGGGSSSGFTISTRGGA